MVVGMGIFAAMIVLLVVLICRELVCWYWKVNEGLELLREIAQNTRRAAPAQAPRPAVAPPPAPSTHAG
jgi:hypothetical protein